MDTFNRVIGSWNIETELDFRTYGISDDVIVLFTLYTRCGWHPQFVEAFNHILFEEGAIKQ